MAAPIAGQVDQQGPPFLGQVVFDGGGAVARDLAGQQIARRTNTGAIRIVAMGKCTTAGCRLGSEVKNGDSLTDTGTDTVSATDLDSEDTLHYAITAGNTDGAFTIDPDTGEITPTELDALLGERDINRLVVAGLATDYCVLATALDARTRGYPTTVLAAGIRAVDLQPGDGEKALAELRLAGALIDEG